MHTTRPVSSKPGEEGWTDGREGRHEEEVRLDDGAVST